MPRLSEFRCDSPLLLIGVPMSYLGEQILVGAAHQIFFSLLVHPQNPKAMGLESIVVFAGIAHIGCSLTRSPVRALLPPRTCGYRRSLPPIALRSCTQTTSCVAVVRALHQPRSCSFCNDSREMPAVHPGQKGIDYVAEPRSDKVSPIVYNCRDWRTQ